jgi:hypothetical protein
MVLTVSFVLSPVIGLSCHRRRWLRLHRLDAGVEASGPHDFAVRVSIRSSCEASASTASEPALLTLRNAPPVGQDGALVEMIWVSREAKYFCKGDWTGSISLIWLNKSSFWRIGFASSPSCHDGDGSANRSVIRSPHRRWPARLGER